jgi:hypothetical protein
MMELSKEVLKKYMEYKFQETVEKINSGISDQDLDYCYTLGFTGRDLTCYDSWSINEARSSSVVISYTITYTQKGIGTCQKSFNIKPSDYLNYISSQREEKLKKIGI